MGVEFSYHYGFARSGQVDLIQGGIYVFPVLELELARA
jgi:hypothetical protein